jgi:hypothetical protein
LRCGSLGAAAARHAQGRFTQTRPSLCLSIIHIEVLPEVLMRQCVRYLFACDSDAMSVTFIIPRDGNTYRGFTLTDHVSRARIAIGI